VEKKFCRYLSVGNCCISIMEGAPAATNRVMRGEALDGAEEQKGEKRQRVEENLYQIETELGEVKQKIKEVDEAIEEGKTYKGRQGDELVKYQDKLMEKENQLQQKENQLQQEKILLLQRQQSQPPRQGEFLESKILQVYPSLSA
jgi:chromosome segregation ATPase